MVVLIHVGICAVLISLVIVVHVSLVPMTLIVIMMHLTTHPVWSSLRVLVGWQVAGMEGAILLVIIMMRLFYIINLISSLTSRLHGLQGGVIHPVGSIHLVLAIVSVHLVLSMSLVTLISKSLIWIVGWNMRYLPCLVY